MKSFFKFLLPKRVDNTVRGVKLPVYVFTLIALVSTVRSCIHIFAPDGGAGSIAGMDLSVEDANGIIFGFALWGTAQLIYALIQLVVAFRYRVLVPFLYLLLILETLVLAVPGYFLLANITQSRHHVPGGLNTLLLLALLFGAAGPVLLIVLLKAFNLIGDIHIARQSQRTLPFLLCILSFALGTLVMWHSYGWHLLTVLLGCYAVNTLLVMVINFKWKISVHATGLGGPIAAFCMAIGWAILPGMLVLLALVCWARVYLRAHSLGQVLAGSGLGFAFTLLFFNLLHVTI